VYGREQIERDLLHDVGFAHFLHCAEDGATRVVDDYVDIRNTCGYGPHLLRPGHVDRLHFEQKNYSVIAQLPMTFGALEIPVDVLDCDVGNALDHGVKKRNRRIG
jgi:hypothetical protein